MRKAREIDMTNGSVIPMLLAFALPMILSSVLQLLFNAVDLIVVSRYEGSGALAAVGATTPLINLFTNFFIGLSMGANVIISRILASGKKKELRTAVHTSVALGLVLGLAVLPVAVFGARSVLILSGTPGAILDMATMYLRIYFLGTPFFMLFNFGAAILRAAGDSRRPMYFLIVAGGINLVFNVFLVLRFHMGVAGVGIATAVSQMVSCFLVFYTLLRSDCDYGVRLSDIRLTGEYAIQMLKVGFPMGLQTILVDVSNVLIQSVVNSFGTVAVAGRSAYQSLINFLYVAINSITQASMTFVSQNYGAGKQKRIDDVIIKSILFTLIVGEGLGIFVWMFGRSLIGIYTSDPAAIKVAMDILPIMSLTYGLCAVMDILPGLSRGLGRSLVPMLLHTLGVVGVRVVWIYMVFPRYGTMENVMWSYPASWIVTSVMQAVYLYDSRRQSIKMC